MKRKPIVGKKYKICGWSDRNKACASGTTIGDIVLVKKVERNTDPNFKWCCKCDNLTTKEKNIFTWYKQIEEIKPQSLKEFLNEDR